MTGGYAASSLLPARTPGLALTRAQAGAIWLMMASSFFVRFEPAPVDLMFGIALVVFLAGGGLLPTAIATPMIGLLTLYNLGAFTSYLQVMDEPKTGMFVITSCYMAISAVFFCYYVQTDTERRFAVFKNGYIAGAVIASLIGLIGYFDIFGSAAFLSPIARAQGLFKDPNVLSTYLILPALLMTQDVMLGTRTHRASRHAGLLLVLACLFLAFSRGAWVNFLVSVLLMVFLTFTLTPSKPVRTRIMVLAIAGAVTLAVLVAALLMIPEVRAAFADRATVAKDYDSGEFGRFSNQLNSIPMLLERPLGFGPLQFHTHFGLDPHNVYVNAFASYGWLGGISYILLILATVIVGFKAVLIRTPWQGQTIALFSTFLATALQGVQIDTDHWRHFYWMLGLVWGFYAASAVRAARQSNAAIAAAG